MATAGDQINRALRLLGVLAEGEIPSTDTSADGLVALNQMLDSWSTERLSVFTTFEQVFTWPAGQMLRTLGPSGDFAGARPIALDESTYYVYNEISYNLTFLNELEYNSLALKTAQSSLPVAIFVNASFENASMKLYPVPTTDLEFHFVCVQALNQADALDTELFFPPGYIRAFAYNLAVELAPEFGVAASQDVKNIANISKRNIKRINKTNDVLSMPPGIIGRRGGFLSLYTGPY